MTRTWLALAMLFQPASAVAAQEWAPPPKIAVGTPLPRIALMREGLRTYLRYRVLRGVTRPIDIWIRDVRFQTTGGRRRLHITQAWTGSTAAPHRMRLNSWFDAGTFAPLTHERLFERAEETRSEGFQFAPEAVTGLAATPSNSQANFSVAMSEPAFNFETDMEMMEALPLVAGWRGRLVFYHPGGPPGEAHIVSVVGSQSIITVGGTIECWQVMLHPEKTDTKSASRSLWTKFIRRSCASSSRRQMAGS